MAMARAETTLMFSRRRQFFFQISRQKVTLNFKVENILEDSLGLIPSPSPSVKIQIIGGKVYLR